MRLPEPPLHTLVSPGAPSSSASPAPRQGALITSLAGGKRALRLTPRGLIWRFCRPWAACRVRDRPIRAAPAPALGAELCIRRWAACSASLFAPVPGQ